MYGLNIRWHLYTFGTCFCLALIDCGGEFMKIEFACKTDDAYKILLQPETITQEMLRFAVGVENVLVLIATNTS